MTSRHGKTKSSPARRGISIIEVLIVMTCVTIGLGLCAVTIQLLLRLEADGQGRYRSQVSLERLARQLRADAHAAADANVDAAKSGKAAILKLDIGPKRGVTYEPGNSSVIRVESRDGSIIRREQYSLPAVREIAFDMRAEAGRRFVALVVTRFNKHSGAGSNRPLETVALLGKDRARITAIGAGAPK
jgi:hypothetical protein